MLSPVLLLSLAFLGLSLAEANHQLSSQLIVNSHQGEADSKWMSKIVVEVKGPQDNDVTSQGDYMPTEVEQTRDTELNVVLTLSVADKAKPVVTSLPQKNYHYTQTSPKSTSRLVEIYKRYAASQRGYAPLDGMDSFYKVHVEAKTWPEARDICHEEGGAHLLIINSKKELDVLHKDLMPKYPKDTVTGTEWKWDAFNYFWTGVHEEGIDGYYVTVQGKPFTSTGYTELYEVDNDRGSMDAYLIRRIVNGLFDEPPNHTFPFICELDL